MRDASALITTVDRVAGVATVTVRGEPGTRTCSRLQDRLLWAAQHRPRRLVLDLDVPDGFAGPLVELIADARPVFPADCLLEVRSADPGVRDLFRLAGLPGRPGLTIRA